MADTIDNILHKLPGTNGKAKPALRVMTVRMPSDLYEALQQEARERKTSANRLALAKLSLKANVLDHVVEAMVAVERGKCSNGAP